jgi:hypothetical protein
MNEEISIPKNSEIDQALKQFGTESQTGQIQKASEASKTSSIPQKDVEGVEFEIPSYGAMKYYQEKETPKMVKLVMKYSGGAIKEQKQAEHVLLWFVIVAIGVSLYLVFWFGHTQSQVSPAEIEQMIQHPLK